MHRRVRCQAEPDVDVGLGPDDFARAHHLDARAVAPQLALSIQGAGGRKFRPRRIQPVDQACSVAGLEAKVDIVDRRARQFVGTARERDDGTADVADPQVLDGQPALLQQRGRAAIAEDASLVAEFLESQAEPGVDAGEWVLAADPLRFAGWFCRGRLRQVVVDDQPVEAEAGDQHRPRPKGHADVPLIGRLVQA